MKKRKLTTIASLAIFALFPTTCPAQVNAEQVMNIGRNVLSMEDYMLAIQYFNQAIKAKPYLADPYYLRGVAKLQLDDYAGAEADCSAALERNAFKTEAYKVRGFARQQMGRDSLAIADYDKGLEHNPTDRYFLFYKAIAQTELRRDSAANETFTILLRQYPRFDEGYGARARLRVLEGDTVGALDDLDHALKLNINLLNARLMRAAINADRKQWTDAEGDMDEVLRLRHDDPSLYVNRAYIRYNADNYLGALTDYNYALQLDPAYKPALFNRALLRYEVKDLNNAAKDFSEVLALEPLNFHALFNRGLVYMEAGKNSDALKDFRAVAWRYPKFYLVYYAMAEALRQSGRYDEALRNVAKADEMVRRYVKDPSGQPLDLPVIASGETNRLGENGDKEESEEEVMARFNQLVTVGGATESTPMAFNDRIKGRVQDRTVSVSPSPLYVVTFVVPQTTLQQQSNYFRELDDFNTAGYLPNRLYLSPASAKGAVGEQEFNRLMKISADLSQRIKTGGGSPAERLGRGVVALTLRDYDAAVADLDAALAETPGLTPALMARAAAKFARSQEGYREDADAMLAGRMAVADISDALADYDAALAVNPRLVYAWFNKGIIHYILKDYTAARRCFDTAVALDPSFGEAYYNRGLTLLQAGDKRTAFADLSKAGELGVLESYNLLKRMQ